VDKLAKFNIGDLVVHSRQGYRAVIIDVDPEFQASGHYNPQAKTRPFAVRNPWYRLLVDGTNLMTYVEEHLLKADLNGGNIDNPQVRHYLIQQGNHYCLQAKRH